MNPYYVHKFNYFPIFRLEEHSQAFTATKEILTRSLCLQHFSTDMPTYLVADASQLNGLGFALIQSMKGPIQPERLLQCVSLCLSPCEKNYATIELECLAMAWALKNVIISSGE